jgi:hypothetical protein
VVATAPRRQGICDINALVKIYLHSLDRWRDVVWHDTQK